MTTAAKRIPADQSSPDKGGDARHLLLIVDDEPEQVRALSTFLRRDYRIVTAGNGEQALDVVTKEDVHLILSDQMMPDMSGVELLSRVRQLRPDAVRLLCTGVTDAKDAIKAINEGHIFRYITKPVNPDDLRANLRDAADRFELIDERKRLLAELREKNEKLEAANAQLKLSDALKTNFIRVASHELRTPLTILMGLTQLCRAGTLQGEVLQEKLKRITGAAQRLQYLIDQMVTMLTLGRFDAQLERRPCNLAMVLRQAADDVRPFTELRKQELVVDVPDDSGTPNVDVIKLRDAINQLLLNAIKFTPDHGTVTLKSRKGPKEISIQVLDTGVGMSNEHIEHVFEPFYTGHDVSRHASGQYEFGRQGIGLGLPVVKAFIELHGGRITVASEEGKGSVFTLMLPVGVRR